MSENRWEMKLSPRDWKGRSDKSHYRLAQVTLEKRGDQNHTPGKGSLEASAPVFLFLKKSPQALIPFPPSCPVWIQERTPAFWVLHSAADNFPASQRGHLNYTKIYATMNITKVSSIIFVPDWQLTSLQVGPGDGCFDCRLDLESPQGLKGFLQRTRVQFLAPMLAGSQPSVTPKPGDLVPLLSYVAHSFPPTHTQKEKKNK